MIAAVASGMCIYGFVELAVSCGLQAASLFPSLSLGPKPCPFFSFVLSSSHNTHCFPWNQQFTLQQVNTRTHWSIHIEWIICHPSPSVRHMKVPNKITKTKRWQNKVAIGRANLPHFKHLHIFPSFSLITTLSIGLFAFFMSSFWLVIAAGFPHTSFQTINRPQTPSS